MGSDRSERSPGAHAESSVLAVTGLASDGAGVARTPEGRVVFVEGAVPGDRVRIAPVERGASSRAGRKRFLRARIAELVEASPDRVVARCEVFGRCGGCAWQHIRYATQLEAKRSNLRAALERIGGLALPEAIEIVASPDELHYRARTRVVEARGGVGYRRRASNEALAVEGCPVLVPAAEAALAGLARAVADEQSASGRSLGRGSRAPAARVREWVITAGSDGTARVFGSDEATSGSVELVVLGERLRVAGPGFVQGNALLWDRLAEAVRDACLRPVRGGRPRRFVELYAGIGFLTLPLARAGLSGVAIESHPGAVEDLRFNLERAGLAGAVEAVASAAERVRSLGQALAAADLLLVDPPRLGLEAPVREAIAEHGPAALVYLSCDPATLARDLARLAAAGYRLQSLTAFDLFPQTPHVEALARLER